MYCAWLQYLSSLGRGDLVYGDSFRQARHCWADQQVGQVCRRPLKPRELGLGLELELETKGVEGLLLFQYSASRRGSPPPFRRVLLWQAARGGSNLGDAEEGAADLLERQEDVGRQYPWADGRRSRARWLDDPEPWARAESGERLGAR
jgi:hypothetical protein